MRLCWKRERLGAHLPRRQTAGGGEKSCGDKALIHVASPKAPLYQDRVFCPGRRVLILKATERERACGNDANATLRRTKAASRRAAWRAITAPSSSSPAIPIPRLPKASAAISACR